MTTEIAIAQADPNVLSEETKINDMSLRGAGRSSVAVPNLPTVRVPFSKWSGKSKAGTPWQISQGDASSVLKHIEKDSFDCVVTSPPYYWLRDYGVEGQIGLEETVAGYVDAICAVMNECRRVLAPDGLLFLNLGDTYYSGKGASQGTDRKSAKRRFGLRAVDKSGGLGIQLQRKTLIGIPWRVALRLAGSGWVLRSSIIWHRDKCLPEHVADRPSRSYEYVFMLAKERRYHFNKKPLVDQRVEEDVWSISSRTAGNSGLNTAPYPEELVERCLEIGCKPGGRVLDPFLGSGTTLRVAARLAHPSHGIELSRTFCEHAAKAMEGV